MCYFYVVMNPILSQFGWTMFNVLVHLKFVLLIMRAVHHMSIITVFIVKMSHWNVVSKVNNYVPFFEFCPQNSLYLVLVVHMLDLIPVAMLTYQVIYYLYQ